VSYDDAVVKRSLDNTLKIAYERIQDFEPEKKIRLPKFIVPENETPEYALTREAIKGLKSFGLQNNREYSERLRRELKTIHKKSFSQYFLTMKAVCDFARKSQLGGPGRGSAAGCLVSYCLGITQVDPIKWGLQFERFLSDESDSSGQVIESEKGDFRKYVVIETEVGIIKLTPGCKVKINRGGRIEIVRVEELMVGDVMLSRY
jgi:DNA polymerase III alpha subunit